jgi:hypothetical protein
MALHDFKVVTEEVSFRGGRFALRGLALNDVSDLVRNNLSELNKLFQLYDNEGTREQALAESARFAITIVRETPNMVSKMIALAADEPEAIAVAARLPLPVQVECMRKIIELTFEEAGGAKKFLDSVMSLVGGMIPASTMTA